MITNTLNKTLEAYLKSFSNKELLNTYTVFYTDLMYHNFIQYKVNQNTFEPCPTISNFHVTRFHFFLLLLFHPIFFNKYYTIDMDKQKVCFLSLEIA